MNCQLTAKNTTTAPNPSDGTGHAVLPVGSHGGLHDLERLPEGGDLEQVQTGAEQQVAELDGLLLQRGRGGEFRRRHIGGWGMLSSWMCGRTEAGGRLRCLWRKWELEGIWAR